MSQAAARENDFDTALNLVFSHAPRAAVIRGIALTAYFLAWPFFTWVGNRAEISAALIPSGGLVLDVITFLFTLFRFMFRPANFLIGFVMIVPWLMGWLAAGDYLSDIFSLQRGRIARGFIYRAAFRGFDQPVLNIESEDPAALPANRRSSIIQIGGPGAVRINYEYAALFELASGASEIRAASANSALQRRFQLAGFERLRLVFDLRDHHKVIDSISARTREGIPVELKHIHILYHICHEDTLRGERKFLQHHRIDLGPLRFSHRAFRALVYNQLNLHWRVVIERLLVRRLQHFISQHSLIELLAAVGQPELTRFEQGRAVLRSQIAHFNNGHQAAWVSESSLPSINGFGPARIPRRELSEYLQNPGNNFKSPYFKEFAEQFQAEAFAAGVWLDWVDVGTITTDSEVIPKEHIEAWNQLFDNNKRSGGRSLGEVERTARNTELAAHVMASVEKFQHLRQLGCPDAEIIDTLIHEIHAQITAAMETYKEQEVPENLTKADEIIRSYKNRGQPGHRISRTR